MSQDNDYASNRLPQPGDYVKSDEIVSITPSQATRDSIELMSRSRAKLSETELAEVQRIEMRAKGLTRRIVRGRVIHVEGDIVVIRTASGNVEHATIESCKITDAPAPKPADATQIEMFGD